MCADLCQVPSVCSAGSAPPHNFSEIKQLCDAAENISFSHHINPNKLAGLAGSGPVNTDDDE